MIRFNVLFVDLKMYLLLYFSESSRILKCLLLHFTYYLYLLGLCNEPSCQDPLWPSFAEFNSNSANGIPMKSTDQRLNEYCKWLDYRDEENNDSMDDEKV